MFPPWLASFFHYNQLYLKGSFSLSFCWRKCIYYLYPHICVNIRCLFFSFWLTSVYDILSVHPCLYKWPHFIPLHGWIIFIVCEYQIPFIRSSIGALWGPAWGEIPKGISYTYVHTYLHTYIPTYIHTYVRTCVHTYVHTYMYVQLIHFAVQKNLTQHCKATMCCAVLSHSVVSDSLQHMACSPSGSSVYGDSPGKNTAVGCHALLQRILPTQGLNPGLLHCRQILYYLSHQGSNYMPIKNLTKKKKTSTQTNLTIIASRYRWANFFFFNHHFLDDGKFLLYVCGRDVCVSDIVCVLCIWQFIGLLHLCKWSSFCSQRGQPKLVKDLKGLLTPKE